ncbi:hypothetical protein, partial [Parvimonas micra]|uniref:hypothetical protein n=1 Tax=Parvimonas micra TaxID=33033 RepID=UPI0024202455
WSKRKEKRNSLRKNKKSCRSFCWNLEKHFKGGRNTVFFYVSSIHLLLLKQKYEISTVDCTQIKDLNNMRQICYLLF